jgi:hypothetical protein
MNSCSILLFAALGACGLAACSTLNDHNTAHSIIAVDAKEQPYPAYDLKILSAIDRRWQNLIQSSLFDCQSGKVVIDFTLSPNGRIHEISVRVNEVGEICALLCKRAIQDPAPYPRWPSDLRSVTVGEGRKFSFTFNYRP